MNWRFIFYINLPCVVVASIVCYIYLRQVRIRQRKVQHGSEIDYLGSITILLCSTALIYAVIAGGSSYPWNSPIIISCLVAFVVLLISFIYTQHRAKHRAIMPLHMFRNYNFCLGNLIMFINGSINYGLAAYMPSYFQIVSYNSSIMSGLKVLPQVVTMMLATTVVGWLNILCYII